jgi:hypothetical protein
LSCPYSQVFLRTSYCRPDLSLQKLKILAKMEELDAYSHQVVIQFPKYEKHVLAAEIRETLSQVIKLSVRTAKRYYKKTTLQDLDIEVEYLRSLVRKCHRLKYINTKRYNIWSAHIDEVGRMVGGWINKS